MAVFNEKGLLNPGFFEYKLEEVEKIFVGEFTESQTRLRNFNGFKSWLKRLLDICIPNELWIDGSFATNKVNPNDVDIAVFIDYQDYADNISALKDLILFGQVNFCDTYIRISPNACLKENATFVNDRNYWRGQFGFDREDNPKGIIKITKEKLSSVKEEIKDVK